MPRTLIRRLGGVFAFTQISNFQEFRIMCYKMEEKSFKILVHIIRVTQYRSSLGDLEFLFGEFKIFMF